MRKIKFRGYDTDDKTWRYGGYFCMEDATLPAIYDSKEQWEKDKRKNEHHLILWNGFSDWNLPKPHYKSEVDGDSVGQYIGRKDKNGVEAYEGDIVKMPKGIVGTIEYCRAGYKVIDWTNYMNELSEDFEIIGNVHETPELVETIKKREDLEQETGVQLGPGESE